MVPSHRPTLVSSMPPDSEHSACPPHQGHPGQWSRSRKSWLLLCPPWLTFCNSPGGELQCRAWHGLEGAPIPGFDLVDLNSGDLLPTTAACTLLCRMSGT